jgi:hypothetical protein
VVSFFVRLIKPVSKVNKLGHIFHSVCIKQFQDAEELRFPARRNFRCPTCRKEFTKEKVFKLYPILETSSPTRGSSCEIHDNYDNYDTDEEDRCAKIERKNSTIMKLVEGEMNANRALEIAEEVQDMGRLLGAAEDVGLDLKVEC